nr:DUF1365 family protein [Cytophagales bacterium]
MDIKPYLFQAKVMHKRLFPRVNAFMYSVYYFVLPLSFLKQAPKPFRFNSPGILSFYEKDHGAHKNESLDNWIEPILREYQLDNIVNDISLIAMPRIFGYVFNPVSFWLCFDQDRNLRAVLSEVNNTFGETHSYLCAHEDLSVISQDDWIEAQKLFHVSPFMHREGYYLFRFSIKHKNLGIWIDYYDDKGQKKLLTSLIGNLEPLTEKTIRRAFWTHPLVTFKTIFLIHWQAIKLILKGIKYVRKPKQIDQKLSTSKNLTKF